VENEAKVAAETARAEAEQELQALRADLERERLKVDVYIPAEASRRAAEATAKGDAAPVLHSGRANAEALRMVAEAWAGAGDVGRELYVLQHLKEFVEAATRRVQSSEIGELNVVDSGDGQSYASALAMYPTAVAEVLRATGRAVGIDVSSLLSGDAKGGA
jgi:flotillin